jgi:hypothetical protein
LGAGDFSSTVLAETARIHPQKYAYVGEPALRTLIAKGEAEASRYGLSTQREILLLVVLMFSFGQGCTEDPIYPWIADTLGNDRVPGPSERASQLKKNAAAWLCGMLANNERDK